MDQALNRPVDNRSNRIIMVHRSHSFMLGRPVLLSDRPPDSGARPFFHLGYPHGRPGSGGQQEEETQDRDELEDHGDGSKPQVLPPPALELYLNIPFAQAPELKPPMM